jgi:glycosyltransferase involved in cell wall biosynthesis
VTGNDFPRRLRLLVVTSTFPIHEGDSGPPFVLDLCRHLASHCDVVVLAPHAPGAVARERLSGIEVIRYRYAPFALERLTYDGGIMASLRHHPWRLLLVPLFIVGQLIAVIRMLRASPFDAVHAHWLIPQGLVTALAVRDKRLVWIATAHGSDVLALRGRIFSAIRRYVVERASGITTVSRALRDYLQAEGADGTKISVIPMGVDLQNRFVPASITRNHHDIITVGRLVDGKRFDVLIRAMPIILKRYPQATLTLFGDGPKKQSLLQLAQELGVHNQVRFAGAVPQSELRAYYQKATFLVLPSSKEGLGLVLAEALGCECAVIASDLETVRDVVEDGVTGLLFPVGDYQALAEQAIRLLADPTLRDRLAHDGRKHVLRHLDLPAIAVRYHELLRALR